MNECSLNMILISHRGNVSGSNPNYENSPSYINHALNKGFECEIDVWMIDSFIYLGHDEPKYKTSTDFISNNKLWCHAKNKEALRFMLDHNIHCFWHEKDRFTITSKGIAWCHENSKLKGGIFMTNNIEDKHTFVNYVNKNKKQQPLGFCSNFLLHTS